MDFNSPTTQEEATVDPYLRHLNMDFNSGTIQEAISPFLLSR
jgi:hypothetical protein